MLAEPEQTGEPIDVSEVLDILREFAEVANWEGPLWSDPRTEKAEFRLDISARDEKALLAASPAVQRVADELFTGVLVRSPCALAGEITQRVKKMPDRDLWQVYLPDGFRLRYIVDEADRVVYVVYLGPHSDSRNDGREAAVRQEIHRRWLQRRRINEPGP